MSTKPTKVSRANLEEKTDRSFDRILLNVMTGNTLFGVAIAGYGAYTGNKEITEIGKGTLMVNSIVYTGLYLIDRMSGR